MLTLYERLLHCLSCLLVPEMWHDWDQRWLAGLSSSTLTVRRDYYGRQWAGARTEYRLELQTRSTLHMKVCNHGKGPYYLLTPV